MTEKLESVNTQGEQVAIETTHCNEIHLEGKIILITGASSGTGLSTAETASQQGARVSIGTRNEDNFARAIKNITTPDNISMFQADISQPDQVIHALDTMGSMPDVIIHSAATGMDFMPDFLRRLVSITNARIKDRPFNGALERLKSQIPDWIKASKDSSWAVNYYGSLAFIQTIKERKTDNSPLLFINYTSLSSSVIALRMAAGLNVNQAHSTPISLEDTAHIPDFYENIAGSKGALEYTLKQKASELSSKGINIVTLSSSVILDTIVGKILKKHLLPLVRSNAQRQIIEDSFIDRKDMVRTALELAAEHPSNWVDPFRTVYILKKGQVVDELPLSHDVLKLDIPL